MVVGLLATITVTALPYVDRARWHILADHIRAGYPMYSPHRINSAVTTYLVILTVVGVAGVLGWIASMWALHAGKGWARWLALACAACGVLLALTGLLTKDTSGAVGLAPLFGWMQLVPCLVGLCAVALLWRTRNA